MKNRRVGLFICAVIIIFLLGGCNGNKNIQLNTMNYDNPIYSGYGLGKQELTFERLVNTLSTNIFSAKVLTTPENKEGWYTVEVIENYLSNVEEKRVKVYGLNNVLEKGKEYVLFTSLFSSNVYEEDFYLIFDEFVLKIEENESLKLLQNPVDKLYINPFKEEKNNQLSEIKELIDAVKGKEAYRDNRPKAIIKAESQEELIQMADHIILIRPLRKYVNDNGQVASVNFETLEIFKGGNYKNLHALILPNNKVEIGKQYIVFLTNTYDGAVGLTTREGSLINEEDETFTTLMNKMKK